MSDPFMPYGQVFKAKIIDFSVDVNDIGDPVFAAQLEMTEQADDPSNVKADSTFTVLEKPFTGAAVVSVTDNTLKKYAAKEGMLYNFMKSVGFKAFDPLEVLDTPDTVQLPDVKGRPVLVQCFDLPDDYVAPSVRDDGVEIPGDTLPEPQFRLMWAVSTGTRTKASDETRKRLADALRKPKAEAKKPTQTNDVPF